MTVRAATRPNVLVAEDDVEMRSLVADCLRKDAFDVIELKDGGRLLVWIARQYRSLEPNPHVDLIVTDLRMPVMTGLEILRGLRSAHCPTPLILMTAFGDDDVRHEAEGLGATFLDKPFTLARLRETARRLLGDARPPVR